MISIDKHYSTNNLLYVNTNKKKNQKSTTSSLNNTRKFDVFTFQGKEKALSSISTAKTKSIIATIATTLGFMKPNPSTVGIEEQKNTKDTEELRKVLSSMVNTDNKKPMYSKAAVDMILHFNDEDPFFAYKLAKALEDSSDLTMSAPLECIAKNLKDHPEWVKTYSELDSKPGNYVSYLFAAEENKKLTDDLIEINDSREDSKKLSPDSIFLLVCAISKEYAPKTIKHYAKEDRIIFNLNDIEYLCERDIYYSKEIEELISFVDENKNYIKPWDSDNFESSFVPEVVETYALYPKEVKRLMKKGVLKAEHVKKLAPVYAEAKPELETLLRKSAYYKQAEDKPVDYDFIKKYSIKLRDLSKEIEVLTGISYEDIPLKELKTIIDDIENNKASINRIIKDGRASDYKKLLPIYNKYPNVEITEQLIARETDPIARFFKF